MEGRDNRPSAKAVPDQEDELRPPRLRVLFVNQHLMMLEGLIAALTEVPDIQVIGATSEIDEVLRRALGTDLDVVVLGIDDSQEGIETARKLRASRPDVAVILLADQASDRSLLEALDIGCSALMAKGRSIADLLAAIRSAGKGDLIFPLRVLTRGQDGTRSRGGNNPSDLTDRELEVLRLLAAGVGTRQIADALTLSLHTVRNHINNVMAKLCVHSRLEAVVAGHRRGLVEAAEQSS